MPRCKNNPSRTYRGTEPSPKGRGFCASGAKIGDKKKGKDNAMWIVKKIGKSQRWVKCTTKKHTKPKKQLSKVSLQISFVWNKWMKDEDTSKRPSNAQVCAFLKSAWVRIFLDHHCQMMGIVVYDAQKPTAYDKVVDMRHAKVLNCDFKKNVFTLDVETKFKSYVPERSNGQRIVPVGNTKKFVKYLKETFNFSIRAGGLFTSRYPTHGTQNDLYISNICKLI